MESLVKEFDCCRNRVSHGISVYGNEVSVDQNIYVKQLIHCIYDFFPVYIQILTEHEERFSLIKSGIASGDFLQGFLLGTREVLYKNGRQSIALAVNDISPFHMVVLIAFIERAVGFYSSFIDINTYHQPRVEARKQATDTVLNTQSKVLGFLLGSTGRFFGITKIAQAVDQGCQGEIYKSCQYF